jgi:hypothetical protein
MAESAGWLIGSATCRWSSLYQSSTGSLARCLRRRPTRFASGSASACGRHFRDSISTYREDENEASALDLGADTRLRDATRCPCSRADRTLGRIPDSTSCEPALPSRHGRVAQSPHGNIPFRRRTLVRPDQKWCLCMPKGSRAGGDARDAERTMIVGRFYRTPAHPRHGAYPCRAKGGARMPPAVAVQGAARANDWGRTAEQA